MRNLLQMRNVILGLLFGSCTMLSAQDKGWKLAATEPDETYVGAPVANGGIGILPWKEPFSVKHVILNHVFENGAEYGISRVLKGINPFLLSISIDTKEVNGKNITGWKQEIDMKAATHTTSFEVLDKADVKYTICALRNMPYAGMIQVEVKALQDCSLQVFQQMEVPKEYGESEITFTKLKGGNAGQYVMSTSASSRYGTHRVTGSAGFVYDKGAFDFQILKEANQLSLSRSLKKGETVSFTLLGTVCSTRDFADPFGESVRQIVFANYEGIARLTKAHQAAWDKLWEGDVVIEGDDEAQRNVRFALYNLYSFARGGSRLSISPMGLSAQGYNGHIFWDTELWMYPPMLLLNQDIARSMIDYRTDRVKPAMQRAYAHGYKGVMFPWESDDTGTESTPTWALTGPFEHHITADVAIAAWHYYCVTKDHKWLLEEGYPLLKQVADFWVSRVEEMPDGKYAIVNVVGANEYASGVTDNAFTNGAAVCALKYAVAAAKACGDKAPAVWSKIANGLRFHSFEDGVTKEHEFYKGVMIKQADVNLLGYPLEVITNPETLKKDLKYYTDKIDPKHGPAMSYSSFCVQYARLGDSEKAYEMFKRSYLPNLRPPFGVLAETPTSQNPYFATGAGGLLQAVINGFAGLKITDNGIVQIPSVLPKHWKKVVIKGVGSEKKTYIRSR